MSAKRTPLTPDELEALAVTYGTPYQLYDEQAMRDNCTALLAAFRAHFGPSFKQFFAVKALPNPAVLRVLVDAGCGLDCSSTSELHIAQALGVAGGDVMYTSNYTSQGDLATAVAQGVIVNLDDASLVASVQRACSGAVPALVSFRLNPGKGRTDSETASNVLGGEHAKFGVPPEQIVEAYRSAKAAGAVRFGMHMMTGSCVLNEEYWLETVGVLVDTVARVQRECGIASFEFINIGGGLGIPYRPEDAVVSVATLPARIKGVMVARWQAAGNGAQPLPALFMENGRYMTGPYGWLVARCHAIKQAHSSTYYGLDACMANLMRPGMYNSYHHITVPAKEGGAREPSNVVGTLCENNDWFAKNRDLPKAALQDLFVIHDTGAHSHSMGFQYNGKLRAPELLLRAPPAGGKAGPPVIELIREREKVEELFLNTRMPADLAARVPRSYPYAQGKGTGLEARHLLYTAVAAAVATAAVLAGQRLLGGSK